MRLEIGKTCARKSVRLVKRALGNACAQNSLARKMEITLLSN